MDDPAAAIALPQAALQQSHGEAGNALDLRPGAEQARLFIGQPACATTQLAAIDAGIVQPFRARPPVGAQQADADPVHVQARAHGLVDYLQAQADMGAVQQIAQQFGELADVPGQGLAPGVVGELSQLRALPGVKGGPQPASR